MNTSVIHEYKIIPAVSNKIGMTAKKAIPQITSNNVQQKKFTHNAYPLRTCPAKMKKVCSQYFVKKKVKKT